MIAKRPDPLKLVSYAEFRPLAATGMSGFVVGDGPIAEIVRRQTGSPFSHELMIGWVHADLVLMAAESTSPESRVVTLRSIISKSPGQVDIYRLRPEIAQQVNFFGAWEFMLRATGQNYPEAVLLHDWLVLTGLNPPHYPNSNYPETRRVCSQLTHAALRVNGMPPRVEYDCCAYPIPDPGWHEYLCTLTYPSTTAR